jgi:Tfp pilus assembly protein PilV
MRTSSHKNIRGPLPQAGFTLIETLVWIAIFTASMVAIATSVILFYRTSNYAIEAATALTSTQRGMDSMVRVIREAAYSSVGAYPVIAMATSSFTFYANTDGDSLVERVRYYLSGTNIYMGLLKPTGDPASYTGSETVSLIADNIKNASSSVDLFTYYDSSGAQMSDLSKIADVRFVTINLVADIDPNRAPTDTELRSSATMRNLTN